MAGPTTDARIYLLDEDDRRIVPGGAGPAVVGPDGTREEIPPAAYRALQHVIEAMRAGQAVKVVPLRTELPIDEAADAIATGRDELRKHVAQGDIPFRSSEYVDWVRLADVINWDIARRERRSAILDEMFADEEEE
ncbi:hypothetical protein [Kribbella speibonae]|uniref:DNA-binding protein n=1 Tax=Kribbella speibonae TaxID=1572660 RepID=A0A4R0IYL2_9ACTN|nr:hypothetical protein [Kribbella speibonae]TCC23402.1 hypothetical protein E0H58_16580 [Kribbella speibonae]TCC38549.1 hypothetical protein E0H92_19215 [Kribbella speibonae]